MNSKWCKVYHWLILFFFCGIFSFGYAQQIELSDRARIGILTVGTSEASHALYGHTAILVDDPIQGIQRVYNFGMFDFDTPNFVAKFTKGDLLYFAGYTSLPNFVRNYVYENRSVDLQILALTQRQKQHIFQELETSLLPQNSTYLYKFIDQNCTTKVVDILNSALDTPIQVVSQDLSYRALLDLYVQDYVWTRIGINLAMASKTDQPINHVFLPKQFMESLQQSDGLVSQTTNLVPLKQSDQSSSFINLNATWFYIVVCLIVFGLAYRFVLLRKVFFLVLGILGGVLLFLWMYSSHMEFKNNTALLLCNPLLILVALMPKYSKSKQYLIYVLLFSLVVFIAINFFSVKFMIAFPLFLVTLLLLLVELFEQRKFIA